MGQVRNVGSGVLQTVDHPPVRVLAELDRALARLQRDSLGPR